MRASFKRDKFIIKSINVIIIIYKSLRSCKQKKLNTFVILWLTKR